MKIVVTSNGADLDAPASPVFGRCPAYVFVDTQSMAYDAVENQAIGAASGAGIQAAQFVVGQGAQAVVTGNVGPNAHSVFQSAGVPIYLFGGGTVREAVEAFKSGELQSIADANTQAGMGMGAGRGMGMGRGRGRGMGMGRGMGRGRSVGRGGQGYGASAPPASGPGTSGPATPGPTPPTGQPGATPEEEMTALKETAKQLQNQLRQVMDRLEQLEEG